MVHLAIVEDDPQFADQLRKYLERYQSETGEKLELRFYPDGEDILENYSGDLELILMDIQMRFMDGMTAAQLIREKDETVAILFITSMAGYAVKGYEVDALDYLVKPVEYPVLAQKLRRALKRIRKEAGHAILIPVENGVKKMSTAQIHFIESDHHQMIYHTADGTLSARGRMDDLEKALAPWGFFRSNKGYLVNMRFVDGVEGECCVVAGQKLVISRRKKAEFMERLADVL